MPSFIQFIKQVNPITELASQDLLRFVKENTFNKGEYITTNLKRCSNLYFLESGLVKLYFIDYNGKEIILRFFKENSVFTSLESYLTEQPSVHFIKTLEKTTVWSIEKIDFEKLCTHHVCLAHFYKKLLEQININMLQRITELLRDDAKIRYAQFISQNAEVTQRINLGDLADYLGITQVSLSRIRGER